MSIEPASAVLLDAAASAAADRHAMDVVGVPSPVLMERAASCVAHELEALRAGAPLRTVVVCGGGNNGGDGLALARILHGWGRPVEAIVVVDKLGDDAAKQLALARASGVTVREGLSDAPRERVVAVDALLGTGSRGTPRGPIAAGIAWLSGLRGPKIAIDLPSGVDPDTGAVHEHALRADLTVTFVRSKPGLHVEPGRAHAGRVVVADIGITVGPGARVEIALVDPAAVRERVRALPAGAHKGERGHVGVVGGGRGTPGAAVLAATAALRSGAGLVTIVTTDAGVRAEIVAHRPELMVAPWDAAAPPLPAARALVVGPGLTDAEAQPRLPALWKDDARPALWDASALESVPPGQAPGGPRVITPHPGEAARLLARATGDASWTSARVQSSRIAAARALADHVRAIVVLKGEGTIVVGERGEIAIACTGGPALATGGSGDVLAGCGGALLARGLDTWDAARVGVHVHGLAGDLAAVRHPGCVALEIADALGAALTDAILAQPVARYPTLRRG